MEHHHQQLLPYEEVGKRLNQLLLRAGPELRVLVRGQFAGYICNANEHHRQHNGRDFPQRLEFFKGYHQHVMYHWDHKLQRADVGQGPDAQHPELLHGLLPEQDDGDWWSFVLSS